MPRAMNSRTDVLTAAAAVAAEAGRPALLHQRYRQVRLHTRALAAPLSEADAQAQSMPDASPAKWHLAHVTWFFETLVLERFEPGFKPYHPAFRVLFNSYYQGLGEQHPRAQRGLLTRPTLAEVNRYRAAVDERMLRLLQDAGRQRDPDLYALVRLGLQHEQQHQELLLTDVLHLLSCNPLAPAYSAAAPQPAEAPAAAAPVGELSTSTQDERRWLYVDGGLADVGSAAAAAGELSAASGFAFDNEGPRHRVWLHPFGLADRLVTQGEWQAFIDDGGYNEARWWLSAGWDWVRNQRIVAPLYWQPAPAGQVFGLRGLQPLRPQAPVLHISHYEADAYARWASARNGRSLRLPTEAEWEHAVQQAPAGQLLQVFDAGWQWTASAYAAYPGYRPWGGAVGEYNGKFMSGQMVLRGASFATPAGHARASYRNFFPPDTRWQFAGLRLACAV